MIYKLRSISIVAFAALLLAACAGTVSEKTDEPPVEDRSATSAQPTPGPGASTQAVGGARAFAGHPLDDPNSLLSRRIVYFDFDKSEIQSEDRAVIEAHARYLADNPGAAVVLEGHADERGSREYNVGLGERRAMAVRRIMSLTGASDGQVQTVSFGEERPAARGRDEAAWQQNRRVEIVYQSR